MRRVAKRVIVETIGWVLVLVGIAALVMPGPGLLMVFAGLAMLSTQYQWAERRVETVKTAALRAAADSVKTWPRIFFSSLGVVWMIGVGTVWGLRPPVPEWWPLDDRWWLPGGWSTGGTMIGSALLAGVLIVYSFIHFREIETEERDEAARAPAAAD